MAEPVRVLIMGAAGRDFHNFNVCFRDNPAWHVVAFTATQIPDIEGRRYPPALAGTLYPEGIPIHAESEMERLVAEGGIDQVVFAYSDVSHMTVMHKACAAMASGAEFRLIGPRQSSLVSKLPVVAVSAVRTGVGKSQTTRKVAAILREQGIRVAIVRHPMPYGDIEAQAVQRFASLDDLDRLQCTLEEREEFSPHLELGHVVYAGVDYERILRVVEQESEVVLWDGGNNDFPFYHPDLHITLVDPHRPGHELSYFPGEVNLRAAHVVIINKADTAPAAGYEQVRRNVENANPTAVVIKAASPITVDDPAAIRGRRVLVVEDGPTLTHGEMSFGAGFIAAQQHGASEIIDPRPHAVGSIAQVFEHWPHIGPVLPAMGYSETQRRELLQTIESANPDVVLIGTPINLAAVLRLKCPAVRLRYELQEMGEPSLEQVLAPIVGRIRPGNVQSTPCLHRASGSGGQCSPRPR